MAKWGQGDPRWIVEERPDAVNVNNWHWTEKEATPWSKEVLTNLFLGMIVEIPSIGRVTVDEVQNIQGEACINNRKAKLIYLYEWDFELKWSGQANGKVKTITGIAKIPNLSDENDIDEVDVAVTVTPEDYSAEPEAAEALKSMMREIGVKQIRGCCSRYVQMLKTEFSSGLILPTKKEGESSDSNSK